MFTADDPLVAGLAGLGFRRSRRGVLRRGNLRLGRSRGWVELSCPCGGNPARPPSVKLGMPGPWRIVACSGKPRCVAEFPPLRFGPEPEEAAGEPPTTLLECLQWALSVRQTPPRPSDPPDPQEIGSWLDAGQLTVQLEQHVRQIEVCHGSRLALRVPIVPHLPGGLPAARLEWLGELLAEVRDRWRMIRVGLVESAAGRSVLAEIDFTGAPRAALPSLVSHGVAALTGAVQWSVSSAELLADEAISFQAWGVRPATRPALPVSVSFQPGSATE